MSTTYAQKQAPAQKKDAPTASSVLDNSPQNESLQRKADMLFKQTIQCYGSTRGFRRNHTSGNKHTSHKRAWKISVHRLKRELRRRWKPVRINSVLKRRAYKKLKRCRRLISCKFLKIINVPCLNSDLINNSIHRGNCIVWCKTPAGIAPTVSHEPEIYHIGPTFNGSTNDNTETIDYTDL